jgi:hypothetical protein
MKNLFLSILVVTAAIACNATNAAVTDAADANAPAGACCASECATSCSDAKKAECAAKKECSAQVCPVTGQKIEG